LPCGDFLPLVRQLPFNRRCRRVDVSRNLLTAREVSNLIDADRRKRHLGDFLVTCERRVIQVHIVDADCHGERRFPEHVSPHVESKFYSWVIGSAVNKATPNHLRCCRYFDCLLPVLLIRRARLPYFWPYHRGFIRPNLERYVVG